MGKVNQNPETKAKIQDNLANEIFEKLSVRFGKEKVEKWQKEFAPRKLNIIEVEDKIAVLRPVTADEVANYSMMVANEEIGLAKASKFLIDELWIDGDRELSDDDEYFISTMLQIQRTMELKKSNFYRV